MLKNMFSEDNGELRNEHTFLDIKYIAKKGS